MLCMELAASTKKKVKPNMKNEPNSHQNVLKRVQMRKGGGKVSDKQAKALMLPSVCHG